MRRSGSWQMVAWQWGTWQQLRRRDTDVCNMHTRPIRGNLSRCNCRTRRSCSWPRQIATKIPPAAIAGWPVEARRPADVYFPPGRFGISVSPATSKYHEPRWRNWQTHYLEVVEPSPACRFKSCPGHFAKPPRALSRRFFVGRSRPKGPVKSDVGVRYLERVFAIQP